MRTLSECSSIFFRLQAAVELASASEKHVEFCNAPSIAQRLETTHRYHSNRNQAVFGATYNSFTDIMGFISFMSLKSAISFLGLSENMPNAGIK